MPVRLLTWENQDASYAHAAAIGAATGYLAKKVLPLTGEEQSVLRSAKNLSTQVKNGALQSAKERIKSARPAINYVVIGALIGMSAYTIANSARKISDITEKKATLDINA